MLRSLVSHFRGEPICVGCEEHPAVSDYLCEYCLMKVADFFAEKDGDVSGSADQSAKHDPSLLRSSGLTNASGCRGQERAGDQRREIDRRQGPLSSRHRQQ